MRIIVLIAYILQYSIPIRSSNAYPLLSASDQVIGQWLIHVKPMKITTTSTRKRRRRDIFKDKITTSSNGDDGDDDDGTTTPKKIKSYYSNFLNILFPKQIVNIITGDKDISNKDSNDNNIIEKLLSQEKPKKIILPIIPRNYYPKLKNDNSIQCLLKVKDDGTFIITPSSSSHMNKNINHKIIENTLLPKRKKSRILITKKKKENNSGSNYSNNNDANNNNNIIKGTTTSRMPLQGKWNIKSNPYCITDRFYDEMILQSFLRVRKISKTTIVEGSNNNHKSIQTAKTVGIERVKIELRCRIWGRYFGVPLFQQSNNNIITNDESNNDNKSSMTTSTTLTTKAPLTKKKRNDNARMIKGTIMIIQSGTKNIYNDDNPFFVNWWKNKKRYCIGTFHGEQLYNFNY